MRNNNIDSIRIKNVDDIDYVAAIRRLAGQKLSREDVAECGRFDALCDEIEEGKKNLAKK